jgi:TRAP-type C4-dicarboxylate transport system permease small subunit
VFNHPSAVSEIAARYLFVWLTMIGGAYVFGKREHMYLEMVQDMCPPKVKCIMEMVCEALTAVFAVCVLFLGGRIYLLRQMTAIDPLIHLPMGYIYMALPISGVIIVFYCICNELMLARKFKDPAYKIPEVDEAGPVMREVL